MMKLKDHEQLEDVALLAEILELRKKLKEIYKAKGPGNTEYITLSIKLDLLMNQYFEEIGESLAVKIG